MKVAPTHPSAKYARRRARRTSELGQDEQRDRSERPEQRRLRLCDHLVREREYRRHYDRGSRGALQRCHVHG